MTPNADYGRVIETGEDGWVRVAGVPSLEIWLRYQARTDGRFVATDARVSSADGSPIDVAKWRSVPVARAETLYNLRHWAFPNGRSEP